MKGTTMFVAIFLATFCAGLTMAADGKEDLYCPPTNPEEEDVLYPKAENCSEFYKCNYGELVTIPCPTGLYYCAENRWCDYPESCDYSGCKMVPLKSTEGEKDENNDNNEENNGDRPIQVDGGEEGEMYCPSDVDGNEILYPNPDDCNKFYQCYYGKLYSLHCQDDLYYCPKTTWCDYAENCDLSKCQMPSGEAENKNDGYSNADEPDNDGQNGGVQTAGVVKGDDGELSCVENGALYPNPEKCNEFYQCAYGRAYVQECPAGLYYCSAKKVCDYPDNCDYSSCKKSSGNKEETGDEQNNETVQENDKDQNNDGKQDNSDHQDGTVEKGADGEVSCDVNGALYPNPENCNEFYQCSYGRALAQKCPAGLYYCPSKKVCDYPTSCDYSCKTP